MPGVCSSCALDVLILGLRAALVSFRTTFGFSMAAPDAPIPGLASLDDPIRGHFSPCALDAPILGFRAVLVSFLTPFASPWLPWMFLSWSALPQMFQA